ncbi:MAG: hypothetical protein RJB13_1093 [Pseudomonadota bacterium]|jgi:outer membrane protein assembly factor BamB
MDVSHLNPESLQTVQQLIIPTVMIPLTAITVALSMLASFIAGLFGLSLKSEGPKRLLEVLLKPRVLLSALVLNVLVIGGMAVYKHIKNRPVMLWRIERASQNEGRPSERTYENYSSVQSEFVKTSASTASKSGAEIQIGWNHKLPKGAFRAPVFSGGSVFVGTFDGHVYELDASTGEQLRRFFVGTPVTPEIMIDDGVLYVGEGVHDTHSARIYAFDLSTGRLKGSYATRGHTEGQPVMASHQGEKTMFVVAGSDGIHAVDPTDMSLKWKVNDGHIDASVRVMGGRVFAGTGREKGDTEKNRSFAVAYDFVSGEKLWKMELPASSWMSAVLWNNEVCFVYGEIYFDSDLGGIACFRQDNGHPTQTYNMGVPQTTMPLIVDNVLYSTDKNGSVCAIELSQRQMKWCQKIGQAKSINYASPVYSSHHNALVYATMNDGLCVLDIESGAIRVNSRFQDMNPKLKEFKSVYAPVAVSGESFVVADAKGNVALFRSF